MLLIIRKTVYVYCRWLDEGDGENGIEQTLALSEILVSDEEEAEQAQDLPGTYMLTVHVL